MFTVAIRFTGRRHFWKTLKFRNFKTTKKSFKIGICSIMESVLSYASQLCSYLVISLHSGVINNSSGNCDIGQVITESISAPTNWFPLPPNLEPQNQCKCYQKLNICTNSSTVLETLWSKLITCILSCEFTLFSG